MRASISLIEDVVLKIRVVISGPGSRPYFDVAVLLMLFSMYLVHSMTTILVHSTHTSICSLSVLMP